MVFDYWKGAGWFALGMMLAIMNWGVAKVFSVAGIIFTIIGYVVTVISIVFGFLCIDRKRFGWGLIFIYPLEAVLSIGYFYFMRIMIGNFIFQEASDTPMNQIFASFYYVPNFLISVLLAILATSLFWTVSLWFSED